MTPGGRQVICRSFRRIDFQGSALGFGAMRLPTLGEYSKIDESLAIDMIRYALDQGVNYIDSAYGYHDGHSEELIAKALQGGRRQKVKLATKSPVWLLKKPEDFDRYLDIQLERLQTPTIDFYLLHNVNMDNWPSLLEMKIPDRAEKARAAGKFHHFGFSFHDTFEAFTRIVDEYPGWDFCQIQYNYMNEDVQAGTKGLRYAAEKGLDVIVMEPLYGGVLVNLPPDVRKLWRRVRASPVELALRWLWEKPEVSLVLSGMSTMEQVKQNVEYASKLAGVELSQIERNLIRKVQERFKEFAPIPCTKCGYCLPCPHGVEIRKNFELYNDALVFKGNTITLNRNIYNGMAEQKRAGSCTNCKECEEKCPQHIAISEWLPKVDAYFKPGRA
jgi:predicted aldo/keto reductase-like oxidoreductase